MNKKEVLVIFFILLSFTGLWFWYSSGATSLTGQSQNWSGRYVGSEENGAESRALILTYKGDSDKDDLPVTYTVNTEPTWSGEDIKWHGTKRMRGEHLYLESKCNDCRIALKREMTITLKWKGEKERLILSK